MDRVWAFLGPILLVAWAILFVGRILMRKRIPEEKRDPIGTLLTVVFAFGFIISLLTIVTDP
jgi:hypothetical protein